MKWFLNTFSLSAPYEMFKEQYGEYAYWYFDEGVKGEDSCSSFCPLLAGLHFNLIIWKGCLHITSLWKNELIFREVTY